ncbi:MAG: pseudouridine synthase [Bacteroidota bacterium]|jgi:23S rRNA pseudouridine2457 synthase
MKKYILFYKPYAVLSQFSPEEGKQTLRDYLHFPRDIYPVGRLDFDSEGLLLLTNDNDIKQTITDPLAHYPKTYLAQVEKIPDETALERLRTGVIVEGKKTRPAEAHVLENEPSLPPRAVPIRFRKTVPTAWIHLTITEGRNRQVRKMTAAVGHPTLRLVRIKIGSLAIEQLRPGEWREVDRSEIVLQEKSISGTAGYIP